MTRPTPAMRRAMADAEVGDDVYGEDPTVNRLEAAFADLVGAEAGLFCPTGTMGNQIALRVHTRPGDAVLAGRRQHVVIYEAGAAALNAGVQFVLVDDDGGHFDGDVVRAAIGAGAHHQIAPALVCVEDTHLSSGGRPWPVGGLADVASAGLPVHLDGARLWHAAAATGRTPAEVCAGATTVTACLSKGLGAPVGSVLAGPADLIARARRERSRLGGGMRQVGVLAAAGLVALERVDRLTDDHARARRLSDAVDARWPGALVAVPETNIVLFTHPDPAAVLRHLAAEGVRAGTIAPGVLRFVTHVDVDDEAIDRTCAAVLACP